MVVLLLWLLCEFNHHDANPAGFARHFGALIGCWSKRIGFFADGLGSVVAHPKLGIKWA
jgi:hypothetical protein